MPASKNVVSIIILTIPLIIGMSSFLIAIPSRGEVWLLRGIVVALVFWILLSGGKIRSVEPLGLASVEDELSVSEARFRALFNNTSVGMGMMGLDRKIINANLAICRMYGRTREELIGMNPADAT